MKPAAEQVHPVAFETPAALQKVKTMSVSRLLPVALAIALVLGAGLARAETDDDHRLRQLVGTPSVVRALLAKGADPNVPDREGRTAVHGAAGLGAVQTMRALLEAGGDPNRRGKHGNTPLHFAADASQPTLSEVFGSVPTIRLLLQANADANRANAKGRTPLHLAAGSHTQPAAVAALLGAGADANRKDRGGSTPLHASVGPNLGYPSVVGALLAGGADPKATNRVGLTALQLFVRVGPDQGATAAMLIEAGADPDRKYRNGEAPLHAAIRSGGNRGKVEVAEALLAGGADPCARDAKRYTPYQVAREGGAIHRALDRAGGHDLACDKRGEQVSEGAARMMQARTRTNVRSGPGTQHGKVGLLEAGQEVRVTGETGDWFRIEALDGGEAFVHASLLTEAEPASAGKAPGRLCSRDADDRECWQEMAERAGCHLWLHKSDPHYTTTSWSGSCPDGMADGAGKLVQKNWNKRSKQEYTAEQRVTISQGKRHGKVTERTSEGLITEGRYVNGVIHGRSITHPN